jgi:hypothetical protein
VVLWEAKPNDPAVPQGKVLARVGGGPLPLLSPSATPAPVLVCVVVAAAAEQRPGWPLTAPRSLLLSRCCGRFRLGRLASS